MQKDLYTLKQLKEKVENTILIPKNIKKQLIFQYPRNDDVQNFLINFFKKYEENELKLKENIYRFLNIAYLQSIWKKENEIKFFINTLNEVIHNSNIN